MQVRGVCGVVLVVLAVVRAAAPEEQSTPEGHASLDHRQNHHGRRHHGTLDSSSRRAWWDASARRLGRTAGVSGSGGRNRLFGRDHGRDTPKRRELEDALHRTRQNQGQNQQPFRHAPLVQPPPPRHATPGDTAPHHSHEHPDPSRHATPGTQGRSGGGRPGGSSRWQPYSNDYWRNIHAAHRPPRPRRDKRPNIILIITDDQDVELGSLNYMPQLMSLMKEGGAYFPHAYTTTPMCCPSRSSILTGMYIHNHEVYTNNDNCSSTMWQQTHERRSFATYLNDAGYRTGYFGKYLNKYNGSHVPAGWREWSGLLMNSRYYNYTVNRNNHWVKYGDQYPRDYFPHVITNDGLHFLKTSKRLDPSPPVMMVLSYPAPHGPEDSAPEHAHRFFNATDHHTVAYNYAPNPDKQWILQFMGRMHDIQLKFTDVLMTKRLQTLQTIDEAVHRIIRSLDALGELDNTYIFYTSDHGYHLGQFGLVKGKSMPFEFDVKVPFLVRGPGIKAGVQINKIALNVDLAPTFLDIAGVKPPPHMDGRSLLPLLKSDQPSYVAWRDSFLVESSGRHREEDALELRQIRRMNKAQGIEASSRTEGGLYTSKHEKLEVVCQNEEYRAPCGPMQKWQCVRSGHRWRLHKCRSRYKVKKRKCVCESEFGMGYLVKLDSKERRKQRLFLKKHVTQDLKSYDPKFLKAFSDVDSTEVAEESLGRRTQRHLRRRQRFRRSTSKADGEGGGDQIGDGLVDKDEVDAFVSEEEMRAIDDQIHHLVDELESLESVSATSPTTAATGNMSISANTDPDKSMSHHGCTATGTSVDCLAEVYRDPHAWKTSKEAIDEQIQRLKHQLLIMKDIRKHLRDSRPDSVLIPDDYEYNEDKADDEDYTVEVSGVVEEDEEYESEPGDMTEAIKDSINATLFDVEKDLTGDDTEGEEYDVYDVYEDTTEVPGSGGDLVVNDTIVDPIMVEEEEEIIIGMDYSDANSPAITTTIINDRRKNKDKPLDVFKEPDTQTHRHRYSESEESETSMESAYNLYPEHGEEVGLPSTLDNETTRRPICWCDKRLAKKLAIQEERAKKRAQRQQLKQERMKRREKKQRRKTKHNLAECNFPTLNCYTHDNDHWRTPPLWHGGKFCFCMNAANNTYWCVRTINDTHNFLYCEFITGLVTYYDLNIDPYQLRNVAFTLSSARVGELHHQLEKLRTCSGADHCDNFPTTETSELSSREHPSPALSDDHQLTHSYAPPLRKNPNTDRLLEREERRRLRKARKKLKRKYSVSGNQVYGPQDRQVLDSIGSRKHKVRLPRKSRQEKEQERERRRERRRRRKSQKKQARAWMSHAR